MGWMARWFARRINGQADDTCMKLVVGLGNPGRKYERTRHNVGFWVVDRLAADRDAGPWSARFDGLATDIRLADERVVLLKPTTFMNRCGRAVRQAVDFYKLDATSMLVVCDDFALKIGKVRVRPGGSSGGQNGLKDIELHLGTQGFPRVRVGIGFPGERNPADFVLSPFAEDERALVDDCVVEAVKAVECWCKNGTSVAMNEFNGKDFTKE